MSCICYCKAYVIHLFKLSFIKNLMDALVSLLSQHSKPTREEAEAAVEVLLRWAGDDPHREGLKDTPRRVVKAYEHFFKGYTQEPEEFLSVTFEDMGGFKDCVLLKDISFHAHCEHHLVPFFGKAHVAYYPDKGVVGLSKIARLVDLYAHRLQSQEKMTAQIAEALEKALAPRGVAVLIEAEHLCMSMRGVMKPGVTTLTTTFSGLYHKNASEQARFISLVRGAV